MVGAIRIQQSICQNVRRAESSAISGERVEILLHSQQGESTGAGTLKVDSRGNSQFKHAPRGSSPSPVLGSAENSPQAPQGAPVPISRAPPLLGFPFVTHTLSEPFSGGTERKPQEG